MGGSEFGHLVLSRPVGLWLHIGETASLMVTAIDRAERTICYKIKAGGTMKRGACFQGKYFHVGDSVSIQVIGFNYQVASRIWHVRIGIRAPKSIAITREEATRKVPRHKG